MLCNDKNNDWIKKMIYERHPPAIYLRLTVSNKIGTMFRMWSLIFSPSASVPIAKSCSTRHSLSTYPCEKYEMIYRLNVLVPSENHRARFGILTWYAFMQSSAKCKCVAYFDSSFWYWGIFLIICDKSRMDCLSPWFIRFESVNFFKFCVTCVETTAICWWRNSTQSSSFSSNNTSLSFALGDGTYLKTITNN